MENLTNLYDELKELYQNLAAQHIKIANAQCANSGPYLVHQNMAAAMRFDKIKQSIESGKIIY